MTSFEQLGCVNILPSCKNNVVTYVFMWVLDTTCKLPSILFSIKAIQSCKKESIELFYIFAQKGDGGRFIGRSDKQHVIKKGSMVRFYVKRYGLILFSFLLD
jgi:hypothetical protein